MLIRDPYPQAGYAELVLRQQRMHYELSHALYQPNGAATMNNSRPMLLPTAQVRRVGAMSPRFPAASRAERRSEPVRS